MEVGGKHWVGALSGAALVHAGVGLVILWQPPLSEVVSTGIDSVEISLAPAPVAALAGGAPGVVTKTTEAIARAEAIAPSEPLFETIVAAKQTQGFAQARQVSAAPLAHGFSGNAGAASGPVTGSASAPKGGGNSGVSADYMALIQAWIEKHKKYPRRAQMRRQEGTALLYFVMDRNGRVIEHRLQRSSGHDLLDQEVAAMIERAQPLPKMPEGMGQGKLELVVPVEFHL